MEIIRSIVLGIVQGLTEFIPISSDGHLVLIRHILGWKDDGVMFDATLHLGTFLALIIFFWPIWRRLILTVIGKGTKEDKKLLGLLVVATIPGVIAGYLGEKVIDIIFRGLLGTGIGFIFTAILLYFADKLAGKGKDKKEFPTLIQSLNIGLMQAIAILPGVSRSGSTISVGIFSGLSKEKAAEFSFLMAMPITGGAGLFALIKDFQEPKGSLVALLLGFLVSFFVGYFAIKYFLKYISQKSFKPFVVYLICVGIVSLVIAWI